VDTEGLLANRAELRKRFRRHFEACDAIFKRIGDEASEWSGKGWRRRSRPLRGGR
jgi:hypothetical protein